MSALPRRLPRGAVPHGTDVRAALWRRSSRSTGANNCVETACPRQEPWAGLLAVRDSKRPAGPALLFSPDAWRDFVAALR
jgi:Domain of unknown function (DUF397)